MDNKESILKRLLEANHITIEELFILTKVQPSCIREIKPHNNLLNGVIFNVPDPEWRYNITCKTPSDYKMD